MLESTFFLQHWLSQHKVNILMSKAFSLIDILSPPSPFSCYIYLYIFKTDFIWILFTVLNCPCFTFFLSVFERINVFFTVLPNLNCFDIGHEIHFSWRQHFYFEWTVCSNLYHLIPHGSQYSFLFNLWFTPTKSHI